MFPRDAARVSKGAFAGRPPDRRGARLGRRSIAISWQDSLVHFIQTQQVWGLPIVFALAFGESLAFVSLLLPATVILFALGGVIGAADLAFWPIWAAAASGAILGDWLSFWLGYRYQHAIAGVWPLSRHPDLLVRGERLFHRWGIAGVFFGRFLGPLRAAVPLVAGIMRMPPLWFQLANVGSGLIWAAGILAPGAFGMRWFG
ncbi:MAG: DedA family protein [Rhodospirillales bacterium]|nr:DedA family protein [Rhodospirillales bacterium]MBN8900815.1 DedA family protein [Rhodospirillales bacterium]